MSFLDDLIGKDAAKEVGQLIEQFDSGTAHEVAPEKAAAHHDAVTKNLSPGDYEQAAKEAVAKLTPEQRQELGAELAKTAKAQGHDVDKMLAEHKGDPSSTEALGKLFSALQGAPGGMSGLLSTDGARGLLENQAFRTALVGVGAMAAKKLL
jgi:hypothetical protein